MSLQTEIHEASRSGSSPVQQLPQIEASLVHEALDKSIPYEKGVLRRLLIWIALLLVGVAIVAMVYGVAEERPVLILIGFVPLWISIMLLNLVLPQITWWNTDQPTWKELELDDELRRFFQKNAESITCTRYYLKRRKEKMTVCIRAERRDEACVIFMEPSFLAEVQKLQVTL